MKSIGSSIIASAIVWAAVIIGCASKLKGTNCYDEIKLILIGGIIIHILFIWGPLAVYIRKNNQEKKI